MRILDTFKKRLLKCVMNLTLRTRIIFLYSVLTFVLILIIGNISSAITLSLLKEKEKSILEDSLNYVNDRISLKIKAINERFINTFSETRFIDLYFQIDKEKTAGYRQVDSDFMNYFNDIVIQNQDTLESIVMVTNSGDLFCNRYMQAADYGNIFEKEYYIKAMAEKNAILYTASDKAIMISKSFYYLSGKLNDRVGTESDDSLYNVLTFFLKKQYLQKILDDISKSRNIDIYIVDSNGYIVVSSLMADSSDMGDYIDMHEATDFEGSGSSEVNSNGRRLVVNHSKLDITGWQLVSIYDQSILNKDANNASRKIVLILLLSLLAVILIANFISNSVTKPIRNLIRVMNRAEENNLDVNFNIKYNDEIADLCRTFNSMMKRINELVLRIQMEEKLKREEELKALQAQINPHFLYNTLDTIYWLAKVEKMDKIADLTGDLGSFFRLSLNDGNDITTIWKEIEHVKKYMSIQKVRYKDKFDYSIRIEESLYNVRIPKLILQPIVENSLVHGFKGIKHKGVIQIYADACDGKIILEVKDNGTGIDKNMIEQLNGSSTYINKTGYALGNVRERIKLHAGTQYGINICSKTGEGTVVNISLPQTL